MTGRQTIALVLVACGLGIAHAESAGRPAVPAEATKMAESWLPAWDAGNADQTYANLSEETRKSVSKAKWQEYWSAVRKPLGALKSRQIVQSKVAALENAPAREGAMVQYQSSFEKKASALETVGMVRDLDGVWRVANYLVQ
jgi:hypothetical protein